MIKIKLQLNSILYAVAASPEKSQKSVKTFKITQNIHYSQNHTRYSLQCLVNLWSLSLCN